MQCQLLAEWKGILSRFLVFIVRGAERQRIRVIDAVLGVLGDRKMQYQSASAH